MGASGEGCGQFVTHYKEILVYMTANRCLHAIRFFSGSIEFKSPRKLLQNCKFPFQ